MPLSLTNSEIMTAVIKFGNGDVKKGPYHEMQGSVAMDLIRDLTRRAPVFPHQNLALLRRFQVPDHAFELRMLNYLGSGKGRPVRY